MAKVRCLYCGVWQVPIEACSRCAAPLPLPDPVYELQIGDRLFDAHGRPVALVEDIIHRCQLIDVTSSGDTSDQYIPGMLHVRIVAVGL